MFKGVTALTIILIGFLTFPIKIKNEAIQPTTSTCDLRDWIQWKERYGKSYDNPREEIERSRIFCQTTKFISEYNRKLGRTQLKLNDLADLTQDQIERKLMKNGPEFAAKLQNLIKDNGLKSKINNKELKLRIRSSQQQTTTKPFLPDNLDWSSDPTIVGPVHNQGDCGCCWAFATLGLIEGRQHKKFSQQPVVPLSAQQLIDCGEGTFGCNGGLVDPALQYIRDIGGVMSDEDYPFVSGEAANKTFKCKFDPNKIQNTSMKAGEPWYNLNKLGDEQYLKGMLAMNEPIVVMMHGNLSFIYAEGDTIIYDEHCLSPDAWPNHLLLLVGYGINEQGEEYWKVKNSWGTKWGQNGYGFIARNRDNHCRIASYPIMLVDTGE